MVIQGKARPEDATYLRELVGTSRLAVVREIVHFWRALGLESFCVLTSELLKRTGRFDAVLDRFVTSEKFSPFIEEAGMQFLRFVASDDDELVSVLATTEMALHATRTDLDKELTVGWPCDPEPILAALLDRRQVWPPATDARRHRMRICRAFPAGYVCELA